MHNYVHENRPCGAERARFTTPVVGGTTKPGGEDARECSRGVLHPPLPLSLSESLAA